MGGWGWRERGELERAGEVESGRWREEGEVEREGGGREGGGERRAAKVEVERERGGGGRQREDGCEERGGKRIYRRGGSHPNTPRPKAVANMHWIVVGPLF